jgi:hypothetical protein
MVLLYLVAMTVGLAQAAAAPTRQAHSGRIDVYVVNSAFDLGQARGSQKARVGSCTWLGEGKERTGVSCEKRLGRGWEEMWVEFVPEGDGEVDIDLQGEHYQRETPDDVRLVWADRVSVQGAAAVNGSFEQTEPDGTPSGWRFTGGFPLERYSRDGSVAENGASCIAVWYGSQARQKFTVERGKSYRVQAWFRVMDPAQVQGPMYVPFACPVDMYSQQIQIELTSTEAAEKATVEILPLYDGHEWAISSRWDDNNSRGDLELHDVLLRHGHKGTFYLNETDNRLTADVANQLMQGGCSIGGHGIGHPMLTYLGRNAIFESVARVRADREASSDTRINSYAFSFCNFRNGMEGDDVHADITRALERAGYFNIANGWYHDAMQTDMILSPIMPSDGRPIQAFLDNALSNEWFKQEHPNISYSMHAWYDTPEKWKTFAEHLDMLGGRPDWWYCNQNQYAAYRYQLLQSRLGDPVRTGKVLRLILRRPALIDVNDPTPLTLEVRGVPRDAVSAVACTTADVIRSEREQDSYRFHLTHDRDQALPTRVGFIHNRDNHADVTPEDADLDFPAIRALLHFSAGTLRLALENGGQEPLTNVRVTYRVPLAWEQGVVHHRPGDIGAGAGREDLAELTRSTRDYKHNSGRSFFLAQVDFRQAGVPGRLHVACTASADERDPSYPQGGFLKLGPIPEAEFDLDALVNIAREGRPPDHWDRANGTRVEWLLSDPEQPPWLGTEIIRTTGRWRSQTDEPFYYLLCSALHSESEQLVEFRCVQGSIARIFLNGGDALVRPSTLHPGENSLLILYRAENQAFGAEHAGCFLRIVTPGTTDRVADIRFEPAPQPR